LWVSHEVRFEQCGSHCCVWVRPDMPDAMLLYHLIRGTIGCCIGCCDAVHLHKEKFVLGRETERFNSKTFQRFWYSGWESDQRVVLMLYNGRHHAKHYKEWRGQHADRFVQNFLPAHAPELSVSEWAWKLTERTCLQEPRLLATGTRGCRTAVCCLAPLVMGIFEEQRNIVTCKLLLISSYVYWLSISYSPFSGKHSKFLTTLARFYASLVFLIVHRSLRSCVARRGGPCCLISSGA